MGNINATEEGAEGMHEVTLRDAARRLKRTPGYVMGAAHVMGIHLQTIGRAICMTEIDFDRMRFETTSRQETTKVS